MKIALVVQNYYPSVGGTQTLFQTIAERLVTEYKDEVEVYTTDSLYSPHHKIYKKILPATETINGVTVNRYSFFRFHLPLFRILYKASGKVSKSLVHFFLRYITGPVSPALTQAIKNINADVILASSSHYLYMTYPLYRHKLKHPKPFVFMGAVHFYGEEHNPLFASSLQSIKKSDVYVANTEYEKYRLIKLGVDENKIETVGVGVDMKNYVNGNRSYYRNQLHLTNEDVLIGYIGRIEKVKGIEVLLQAFIKAAAQQANLKLVIAGFKTLYSDELRNTVSALDNNISDKIFFLNDLTAEEKTNLFHALDVFVLPSFNESFGIVFLEAWACKIPVIGTCIGAVASVVKDGEDGLLAKPDDTTDLSSKILQLGNDALLRTRLGEAGYKKTAELYTWDVIVKRYRDILIKTKQNFHV